MSAAADLLVVVVAYRRAVAELPILRVTGDVAVLVQDNSPDPQRVDLPHVTYVHDPTNPGVSAAYNRGFALARERGLRFVMLLDQDSWLDPAGWAAMLAAIEAHGDDHRLLAPIVAGEAQVFSPFRVGFLRNRAFPRAAFAWRPVLPLAGLGLINSGLVVPLVLVDEIGGYNERIRLDFSDTWFVARYRRAHADVVLVDAVLHHSLSGEDERDAARELARFRSYCAGAREMVAGDVEPWRVRRLVAARALRLGARYRTLAPLRTAAANFLRRGAASPPGGAS